MTDKEPQPPVGSHDRSSERAIRHRGLILAILTVGCLSLASLLYAVRIMSDSPEAPTTTLRRDTMFSTQQKSVVNHRIPPIDLSAPDQTATATFALG